MWKSSTMMPVPSSGHIFETTLPVLSSDLDESDHVRPDGIARYLQEAGFQHLIANEMDSSHPHWIVRRTVIDVIKPVKWPDKLRARRWCAALSSRWCSMRIRLDGADGALVETEAFWICMNLNTQAPARMSDEFINTIGDTTSEHRLKWKSWLSNPVAKQSSIKFHVRRTDIDMWKHVTNSAYWQGIHEVTAGHSDITSVPHRYVIEYNKPITSGEDVRIWTELETDGTLQIAFAVGDEVRTRAAVMALP
ncbi:MAG: hypothetical protein LLG14_01810 [Nocardiaceae bacterium]|nr:hypothetical protein [Nocardiaceae bacterium]